MKNEPCAFEPQPTLTGPRFELRPLRPEDYDALFAAASDPLIWEVHPESDRHKPEVFRGFFDGAIKSGSAFGVYDRGTGRLIGSSRYYDLDPVKKEVAIGFTFLARAYWGGSFNRELKTLMLDHAFRFVDAVIFHVGEGNVRSRKAMEKIGGVLCGSREKAGRDGRPRVDVIYRIEKKNP